jgi:hypothetical protein
MRVLSPAALEQPDTAAKVGELREELQILV